MLVGVTLLIVVGMLYFGVRFKGYRPVNRVEWSASEGLYFRRSAIAYTDDFFAAAQGGDARKAGLTIEMLLRVEDLGNASFRYILSVHAGSDKRQLLIGQWRHWLVVMNGDDYDSRQGVPKLYVDLSPVGVRPFWLAIVAGEGGTAVYVDGRLAKANANLHLAYPNQGGRARLVLGNSVYAKHAWSGAIGGLALYDLALEGSRLQAHYARLAAGEDGFASDRAAAPKICYRFEQLSGGRVVNRSVGPAGGLYDLKVPALMSVLKMEFLQWPRFSSSESRWHMVSDVVLNLIGFVPLGFMLMGLMGRMAKRGGYWGWGMAVGVAFSFSLFLEVTQAWIPSRDSSLLDLLMNTAGAGLGAWVGLPVLRKAA
jgi:VanZ family protein